MFRFHCLRAVFSGSSVKTVPSEWQTFEGIFKPTEDLEGVEWAFDYAQGTKYQGNASSGDEIWFDDMIIECLTCEESDDPVCAWSCPEGLGYVIPRSDVRLNQVGYYPDSVKVATYETDSDKEAMDFRVLNEKGEEVYKQYIIILGKIAGLGEPDSTIIIQKYYYGRSAAEIAGMVKLTPENIRVRSGRAVKKLKEMLEKEDISL